MSDSTEERNEAEIFSNFRTKNAQAETALFSRDLESQLVHGLPPQLNEGFIVALVRSSLREACNIRESQSLFSLEIFDITMMELKADLQNRFIGEPDERLTQILAQSPFSEKDIRRELYEFIEDKVRDVSDTSNTIKKRIFENRLRFFIQDVDRNGHRSALYTEFLDSFTT
jgi:hypothetical protein